MVQAEVQALEDPARMALYTRAETAATMAAAVAAAAIMAAAAAAETMMVEPAVVAVPVSEIPRLPDQAQLRGTRPILTVALLVKEAQVLWLMTVRVAMETLGAL